MGSSLYLSGGVQATDQLVKTVSQAHSFAVGDVVRFDSSAGEFVKAQANTALNAEVVGVVSSVATGTFEMVISGAVDLSSVGYLSGITAPVMFLSASTAGRVSSSPPSLIGSVIKPILIRNELSQKYIVNNFLGTQIGGTSTVAIDEIQPIGTIIPFAGSVVPDTWLECNGTSYGITAYPELYTRLLTTSGDRVPLYGYVARLTISGGSVAVGGHIQYRTETFGPWSGGVSDSNAAVVARVISVETVGANQQAVVQVLPRYSAGNFSYPLVAFGEGFAFTDGATSLNRYRYITPSGTVQTFASASVTSAAIEAFNTPDLRGRFALGRNIGAITDTDPDAANNSAIAVYDVASFGGEERHTLTTGEMPSHSHTYSATDVSSGRENLTRSASDFNKLVRRAASGEDVTATGTDAVGTAPQMDILATATLVINPTGNNTAHNNMPPYLAVRYIIKARAYARAAIIDGADIPYSSLLVSDLRDGAVRPGGNGEDLLFRTNNGIGGNERMRLTNSGNLLIGSSTTPSAYSSSLYSVLDLFKSNGGGALSVRSQSVNGELLADQPTAAMYVGTRTAHPLVFRTNLTERMRLNADGRLDITGEARSSVSTTSISNAKTLVTKDYVDARGAVIFNTSTQVLDTGSIVYTPTLNYTSTRQQIQLATYGFPSTARYAILTWHLLTLGNTPYNVWAGSSQTLNTGHRVTWATTTGSGDVVTTSVQMLLPIHRVSNTDARIYWNFSSTPGTGGDRLLVDLNGYYDSTP